MPTWSRRVHQGSNISIWADSSHLQSRATATTPTTRSDAPFASKLLATRCPIGSVSPHSSRASASLTTATSWSPGSKRRPFRRETDSASKYPASTSRHPAKPSMTLPVTGSWAGAV